MLREAGFPDLAEEVNHDDVRQVMPAVLATIRSTLAYRPAARAGVPVKQ